MENISSTFNARAALLILVLLVAPLALAACGKGSSSNLPVAATEGGSAAEPTMLAPGEWKFVASDGTDLVRPFGSTPPPSGPSDQPSPEPTNRSETVCITPAMATTVTPELLLARVSMGRCEKHYWNVGNGTIDGDLTCPGQAEDIREVPVRVTGSYSRERVETEIEYRALGMTFRQKMSAERTGECS